MTTRKEAGIFALETIEALVWDFESRMRETDWSRFYLYEDFLQTLEPEELADLVLTHFPDLGKWFDRCISTQSWSHALPAYWMQVYQTRPDWLPVENGNHYLPVIDEFFPGWNGSADEKGSLAFPLDPEAVFLTRQILYMHKKFSVQWKEGSSEQVTEEFWFRGCGAS